MGREDPGGVEEMRNISFALTKQAFIFRSKFVTRRVGWKDLKPGDYLQGVEKAQGLKRGERVKPLGVIRVVSVRFEPLRRMIDDPVYGNREVVLEGFPNMSPERFVELFCSSHKGTNSDSIVTRIEFEYTEA